MEKPCDSGHDGPFAAQSVQGKPQKPGKTLRLDSDVSLPQWTDQPGGFQAASGCESEREQPLGGKSQTIPWLEIEKRYAAMFTKRKGKMNMLFALENLILADRPCPAV